MASCVAPARSSKLAGRITTLFGDGQQQVLGGDELVLEVAGLVEGALQNLIERLREIHSGLHAPGNGERAEQAPGFGHDGVGLDVALLQHRPHDAFLLFGQSDQQVQRKDNLAAVFAANPLRLLQGLLSFLSQPVDTKHMGPPGKKTGAGALKRAAQPLLIG